MKCQSDVFSESQETTVFWQCRGGNSRELLRFEIVCIVSAVEKLLYGNFHASSGLHAE